MENSIPKTWVACKFGDVAKIQNGYAFPSKDFYKQGHVPLIKQSQLDGDKVTLDNCVYLDKTYLETKKDFILQKGDVLIGMSGSIGKLCIYDLSVPALQNQRTGRVIPKSSTLLNQRLLWYFLLTVEAELKEKGKGLGVSNVSAADIESLRFNLPPLAEQQRIVAKLDELMEKIDRSRARLERIPKILKRFRQSVLSAAVSGRLTEEWRKSKAYDEGTNLPQSWKLVLIDQLVNSTKTDIRTGPFGTSLKKNEHQVMGVPVWGIESIGDNGIFTGHSKIFVTSKKAKELKSFEVKGGDIIISRSGTVGEICILPNDVQYGLISTNLMKIVLNRDIISPKYFCWLFAGSFIVIEKLNELCKGSTRIFLTQAILKQITYPLPPRDEQDEIIRRVEKLLQLADKLEKRHNRAKAQIDNLPQSLLAKAFRGELVKQEENDEPAQILLDKIEHLKRMSTGNIKKQKRQ